MSKVLALVSGMVFTMCYLVFIGLFAAVWNSVKKVEDNCLGFGFEDYKKQAKKSSREFLGYFICSFILIFGSIVCTFISAFTISQTNDLNASNKDTSNLVENKGAITVFPDEYNKDQSQIGPASGDQLKQSQSKEPVIMPISATLVGKEFSSQFAKLNKYMQTNQVHSFLRNSRTL
jgi:hypothetical protein